MRGNRRIFALAALLSILLAVPLVFGLGLISVPEFSLWGSSSVVESSSTASVFVDPAIILNEALQSGSYFEVHVNVSGITDLFAWQINMSWDPAILSINRIIPAEFLATSPNQTSSEALGWVVNSTDNAQGYSGFAETILGNVSGISGSGRLASIEFLVVGYGSTDLNIGVSGNLTTTLLDSAGGAIAYGTADGYFRNKYPGDIDGDKYVGSADFSVLAGSYGSSEGQPAYNREADMNLDGYVGSADFSALAGNYGKTFP